jgi:hypothetical protein
VQIVKSAKSALQRQFVFPLCRRSHQVGPVIRSRRLCAIQTMPESGAGPVLQHRINSVTGVPMQPRPGHMGSDAKGTNLSFP